MKNPNNKTIEGKVGEISYSVDQSIIDRLRDQHLIDAVKEIEEALEKVIKNEDKSTKE